MDDTSSENLILDQLASVIIHHKSATLLGKVLGRMHVESRRDFLLENYEAVHAFHSKKDAAFNFSSKFIEAARATFDSQHLKERIEGAEPVIRWTALATCLPAAAFGMNNNVPALAAAAITVFCTVMGGSMACVGSETYYSRRHRKQAKKILDDIRSTNTFSVDNFDAVANKYTRAFEWALHELSNEYSKQKRTVGSATPSVGR